MAQSNLIYPLESLHGKISKKSETIFRHKAVYDKNGNVIAQYAQESYVVEHPRDWKKHLPKGAKKQCLDYWITICQRAKGELKHGETNTPINLATRKPQVYTRFDRFVCTTIFRSLNI